MKTASSHPDKDNPRDAVASSDDKATTQPKKGVPGKREHRSPSSVEDARDVTEFKQTEELRRSEERFRSLIQNASDVILIMGADQTVRYISPSVERVLGYKPEEVVGKDNFGVVHPDDMDRVGEVVAEAVRNPGTPFSMELRLRHKDGSWRHVETICTSLLEDPAVEGVVFNTRDITDRRRAEERLRESEERYRTLVEKVPAVIYINPSDGSNLTLYVSPQIEAMLGYTPEEWMATDLWAECIHPDDVLWVLAANERSRESGEPLAEEYRLLAKDGSVVWVKDETALLRDEAGEPLFWQGVMVNITERKRAEEERAFLASIVESSSDAILSAPLDGTIASWNRGAERLFGYSAQEIIGQSASILIPAELRYMQAEALEKVRQGHSVEISDTVRLTKDGTRIAVSITVSPIQGPEDNVIGISAIARDITERKRAEEALKESEEKFRSTFEEAAIGMAVGDLDGHFLQVNRSLCEMLGYSEEELLATTYLAITHPDDLEADLDRAGRMLDGEADSFQAEKRYLHADGHVVWILLNTSVVRDSEGHPLYYIAQIQDITERKRAERRLKYQATHDLLTDLPNRHVFTDSLKHALQLTRRTRGRKVAVLYLDLDNFKAVNDSLGHEAGDRLLAMVGERLRWCLRPEDILARFGGDEFAILLEEVEAPSDAAKVAERIVECFREPLVLEGREFVVKPSIGIALGEARTKRPEELLRDADTAMYQAKGRDEHYSVFDPAMYEQALRRLKLEGDLRRAIEDEEFVVCYQPIVDLRSEEVWGVEALVRWEHPEHQELLAPSQFISVAEEAGLVVPMGGWVLEQACRQGARWQQEHPHVPPLVMSVNLSAKQLQHPDVAEMVEETLKETGFDAGCLSLDITETLYIEALEGNTAALDKLKEMGIRISIDDFGVGYSSLSYLKRLPADALKIDRSFIKALGEEAEDRVIMQMIIELAHTFGMEVIAEGVESAYQAEQLKEMGCELAQGYYFTEPLSPEAVPEFLAR